MNYEDYKLCFNVAVATLCGSLACFIAPSYGLRKSWEDRQKDYVKDGVRRVLAVFDLKNDDFQTQLDKHSLEVKFTNDFVQTIRDFFGIFASLAASSVLLIGVCIAIDSKLKSALQGNAFPQLIECIYWLPAISIIINVLCIILVVSVVNFADVGLAYKRLARPDLD